MIPLNRDILLLTSLLVNIAYRVTASSI